MNLDESLVGSRRSKSFYCHCQLCSHLGDDLPQPIHLGWGENANELGSVTEFQNRFSWQEQTLPTVCKSRHRQLGHDGMGWLHRSNPMGPMGLEERAHPSGSQRIQSLHCESSLSGKAHFERCSQPGDDGRDEQFPQLRTVVTRLNTSGMGM